MIDLTIEGLKDFREIGRGGNARVYRAYQAALDRFVAVKVIGGTSDAVKSRFDRERKAMGRLSQHPGIVTIFDSGFTDEGEPYLIMPYLRQGSLKDRILRQGPIPWRTAIDVVLEVALAVDYGHRHGILHLDIKPANILSDNEGAPKLADFGIARLGDEYGQSLGFVELTPAFSPPELGDVGQPTRQADIYSLAATLTALVTGRPPFTTGDPKRDSSTEVIRRVLAEPPPDLASLGVPSPVASAVQDAMAKAPADRPAKIKDFTSRLHPAGSEPGSQGAKRSSPGPQRDSRRVGEVGERLSNLPLQFSSFVGREKEIEATASLISDHRLVTLTGAGGIGKTRLAIETGWKLIGHYRDGVTLIELASLTDSELLASHVASTLHIPEQAGESLTETLVSALSDKQALVILDNCEHLIESVSDLATSLLQRTGVSLLTTSREALRITGEAIHLIDSLHVSEGSESLPPAIALFVDRSAESASLNTLDSRELERISEICEHLDGIPLGIEIAASRLSTMTLEDLARRIRSRFKLVASGPRTQQPHHRTLQAAIEWSYDLLTHSEQMVFTRLSVFRGGFTLDAAERVCSFGQLAQHQVAEDVAGLVEQSLVTYDEGKSRYSMLETIRQFAEEKMIENEESTLVRSRHVDYFFRLSIQARDHLRGAKRRHWLDRLDEEISNLRTALSWAQGTAPNRASSMAAALGEYWESSLLLTEGHTWLTDSMNHAERVEPSACFWRGRLAQLQGRRSEASNMLGLAFRGDDLGVKIHAKMQLAMMEEDRGQGQLLETAYRLALKLGDPWYLARVAGLLANVAGEKGDVADGKTWREETLQHLEKVEDPYLKAAVFNNLAMFSIEIGDAAAAVELAESAEFFVELAGHQVARAYVADTAALAQLAAGNTQLARRRLMRPLREAVDSGAWTVACMLLETGAQILVAEAGYREALKVLAATSRFREERSLDLAITERRRVEDARSTAFRAISEPAAVWDEGQSLQLQEAAVAFLDERSFTHTV